MSFYNPGNIARGAKYELLSHLTGKKKHTIQIQFSRKKMNVDDKNDVLSYVSKNPTEIFTTLKKENGLQ